MTPLILVSPDVSLEARLREVLAPSIAADMRRWWNDQHPGDPAAVAAEIATAGGGLVCLGPELSETAALALAEAFDIAHPNVSVVLLGQPSAGVWFNAMRVGVRGIVSPRSNDQELASVLAAGLEAAGRRRPAAVSAMAPPSKRSQVIVVVSPKGGSGKTMVAVNLAVSLAKLHPNEVALMDLDVQFGDVASGLQLDPQHSLIDVARSGSVDATSIKVFLTSHASSLWVLTAPDTPADADDVTADDAMQALKILSAEFPYVIVDTGAGLNEVTLAAVEHATDLVFVPTLDVSSVRALRKELAVLDSLGVTSARRHLVLNRADARVGLDAKDVEAVLGLPIDLAVMSSKAVPIATNQGLPLVDSDPKAPVTRQLEELATRFSAGSTGSNNAGGWLRRRRDAR